MTKARSTVYVGRVGNLKVEAPHRRERIRVRLGGELEQLDRSDVPFLIRVLREAYARSSPDYHRKD